ncbi:MAG: hypothetical protein QOG30_850, partial [Acidimicrobiaceae bacterium]
STWSPDVVHVTHAMKFGVGAIDACGELRVPVVVTLTDFWFLCPRHTLLTWEEETCDGPSDWRNCLACVRDLHGIKGSRREATAVKRRPARMASALTNVDRVVVLSRDTCRRFEANGFAVDGFDLVPHGLEPDAIGSPVHGRRPGRTRFAFIGSLVAFKGAGVVIAALASVPTLDVELVVHGDGPLRDALDRQSAADSRVRLAGPFPSDEFGDVIRDADYVVVPSLWYENEPLVVKAAMHLGVPVLASRVGSLADMVDEGVDGWTVPPGDVAAWAAILTKADSARDDWPRTGRPQPTMDDTYTHVEAIYRQVSDCRT